MGKYRGDPSIISHKIGIFCVWERDQSTAVACSIFPIFFQTFNLFLLFATLLWFFQRQNLAASVMLHYTSNQIQLFFFKKHKLAKSKTNCIYLKKQREIATSNSIALRVNFLLFSLTRRTLLAKIFIVLFAYAFS